MLFYFSISGSLFARLAPIAENCSQHSQRTEQSCQQHPVVHRITGLGNRASTRAVRIAALIGFAALLFVIRDTIPICIDLVIRNTVAIRIDVDIRNAVAIDIDIDIRLSISVDIDVDRQPSARPS